MIKYNVKAGLKMDEYNTPVPTAYMYKILQSLQCFYKTLYNVHSELSQVPGTDPIAKMFLFLHVTNSVIMSKFAFLKDSKELHCTLL